MPPGASRQALVLCYHAVSPTWPAPLSVTPERFRSQVGLLLRRGYEPVTLAQASEPDHRRKLVAVTFDDAYRSVLERAAPILAELGAPATIFAPTAFVGSDRPMSWPGIEHWLGTEHEPELIPLRWQELAELADAGWEVGSHTMTHPRLTSVDDDVLREELTGSRAACEDRLGRACTSIAYPYGDVDSRVAAAAAAAGYRLGAGLPGSFGGRDRFQLARVGIYHGDPAWRFELKVAAPIRRLRGARKVGPLISAGLARRTRGTRRNG
jgi:peptidoglycan/xylan/chitin deacetylase (PgdA/CDA1 family)